MWDELEKMTGKKVDLVSVNALSPYVREFVNRDKILIYEKRKARRLHQAAACPRRNRGGARFISGHTFKSFIADEKTFLATVKQIEIIGIAKDIDQIINEINNE